MKKIKIQFCRDIKTKNKNNQNVLIIILIKILIKVIGLKGFYRNTMELRLKKLNKNNTNNSIYF